MALNRIADRFPHIRVFIGGCFCTLSTLAVKVVKVILVKIDSASVKYNTIIINIYIYYYSEQNKKMILTILTLTIVTSNKGNCFLQY